MGCIEIELHVELKESPIEINRNMGCIEIYAGLLRVYSQLYDKP